MFWVVVLGLVVGGGGGRVVCWRLRLCLGWVVVWVVDGWVWFWCWVFCGSSIVLLWLFVLGEIYGWWLCWVVGNG